MKREITENTIGAVLREDHRLRTRSVAEGFRALVDYLSPRLPKIFPAEF